MAKLSQNNFFSMIRGLVMGGGNSAAGHPHNDAGFFRDIAVPMSACATTGTRATATNSVPADAIVLDAAAEDVIVGFTVPRDYDEATDDLKVILLVRHVSGTSIDIQPDSVSKADPATDIADVAGYTAPAATTVNAAFDIGEIEADLSDLDTERFDNLHVNFAASNVVSVGIAHVIGARIEYRSTLVSYDEEDASGNCLR